MVVIPDLWGKSSDKHDDWVIDCLKVVIPDLWGKSSDISFCFFHVFDKVVIPDLWGKSSDTATSRTIPLPYGRNPRFVGQVFRLHLVKKP